MRGGFALNWHAGSDLISLFNGPHFVRTARGKKDHEFVARLRLHFQIHAPFLLIARALRESVVRGLRGGEVGGFPVRITTGPSPMINATLYRTHASAEKEVAAI